MIEIDVRHQTYCFGYFDVPAKGASFIFVILDMAEQAVFLAYYKGLVARSARLLSILVTVISIADKFVLLFHGVGYTHVSPFLS
jgi:hypothetical protein